MRAQGLVTVMKDDKVVMKIVTGTGGYYARKLAYTIKCSGRIPSLEEAYDLAVKCLWSNTETLVVMDEKKILFKGKGNLGRLYRKTFALPKFNPRWECGLIDHFRIVKFKSKAT
ncbi:MAG: hypothetical protein WCX27_02190 [Candidatus Paceibacterota bacterium]